MKTPLAYVMRMASNAAVDRIRSEHRHLSGTELDLLVDELVDQNPGPARQAMGRAELEALSSVIDAMPRAARDPDRRARARDACRTQPAISAFRRAWSAAN